MIRPVSSFAALILLCASSGAYANDDGFEFWLNPSVTFDLDEDTGLEIETAQRFRNADEGRVDTYFVRLWVNQDLNDDVTVSGAVEQRVNDGGPDERRLIQQLTTSHGILRTRLRFEQRFVNDADRMGLRLRPRLGVSIPLGGEESPWSFGTDAELLLTLRSNNVGGDDGLTGLRTQVGVSYDVNDSLSLNAKYLRNQDIREGREDVVGHAPLIGIEYGF